MTIAHDTDLFLKSATLPDGSTADVLVRDGAITAVDRGTASMGCGCDYIETDLAGHVLLPSPVEPHAHLDKALLGGRALNAGGDLTGAIESVRAAYASMSEDDIERRAFKAVSLAVARGCTAIRTHVDCGQLLGSRGVEAIVRLRERLRGAVDLQVVALVEAPWTGVAGRYNRRALEAAVSAGADLIGGCPALDDNPRAALAELLAVARSARLGLDLHIDETVDADTLVLWDLAQAVTSSGFDLPVTASHCVSLGVQNAVRSREIAAAVAAAHISVVTLPQTNLYLQGRSASTQKPRGLTAIEDLRRAGVPVAGGGDNWRDPFNPMGRVDPLETASLLVVAGHMSVQDAYASVSNHARSIMGLPEVHIEAGYPADLLALRGESLADAVADASEHRLVIRAGRVLARTEVRREWSSSITDVASDVDTRVPAGKVS